MVQLKEARVRVGVHDRTSDLRVNKAVSMAFFLIKIVRSNSVALPPAKASLKTSTYKKTATTALERKSCRPVRWFLQTVKMGTVMGSGKIKTKLLLKMIKGRRT